MPLDISIHAPREGSDKGLFYRHCRRCKISIHAPREGSDGRNHRRSDRCSYISIHAPREGSDAVGQLQRLLGLQFLSTLPARGATL